VVEEAKAASPVRATTAAALRPLRAMTVGTMEMLEDTAEDTVEDTAGTEDTVEDTAGMVEDIAGTVDTADILAHPLLIIPMTLVNGSTCHRPAAALPHQAATPQRAVNPVAAREARAAVEEARAASLAPVTTTTAAPAAALRLRAMTVGTMEAVVTLEDTAEDTVEDTAGTVEDTVGMVEDMAGTVDTADILAHPLVITPTTLVNGSTCHRPAAAPPHRAATPQRVANPAAAREARVEVARAASLAPVATTTDSFDYMRVGEHTDTLIRIQAPAVPVALPQAVSLASLDQSLENLSVAKVTLATTTPVARARRESRHSDRW